MRYRTIGLNFDGEEKLRGRKKPVREEQRRMKGEVWEWREERREGERRKDG